MGARWFCNHCGREIWQGLASCRKTSSVLEMERDCVCSDCMTKLVQGEEISPVINPDFVLVIKTLSKLPDGRIPAIKLIHHEHHLNLEQSIQMYNRIINS